MSGARACLPMKKDPDVTSDHISVRIYYVREKTCLNENENHGWTQIRASPTSVD